MKYGLNDIFSIKKYSLGKYIVDEPKRTSIVSFWSSELIEDDGKEVPPINQIYYRITTPEDDPIPSRELLDKHMEEMLSGPVEMPEGVRKFSNAKDLFRGATDITERDV